MLSALAAIQKIFASRTHIHNSLQDRMPKVRDKVFKFFASENLDLSRAHTGKTQD